MRYKKLRKFAAVAMAALLIPGQALYAQTGGVATSGAADISRSGNVTSITQSTDKAAINWQTFNIRPEETVNFNQPGVSSVTLNRVIGNERSVIEGVMNADGQVFLINSSGILFTKDASLNTGGFLASALNLTDEDFNAGRYVFQGDGKAGGVVNMGAITAKDGGYVALLGNSVSNQGIIRAEKGTVALAGGDKISLNFGGNSLLGVIIDEGTLNALVETRGAIIADGGRVYLTAKAAGELLDSRVNTEGLIQARTIGDLKGNIEIYARGGAANIAGTLDASVRDINETFDAGAPNGGDGGFIETSGDRVKIAEGAVITTKSANGANGEWLIDPDGFTVGLTANDGDMSAATLNANLANGNVTIQSVNGGGNDGNININGAVDWSRNTLTLNATNNIYVNNVMTATGTAGLTANYGRGVNKDETPMGFYTAAGDGGARVDFSSYGVLRLNSESYTVINAASQLAAARNNPGGRFALGSDIDMSSAAGWTSLGGDAGFTGIFNGLGHLAGNFSNTSASFFGTIGSGALVSNLRFAWAAVDVSSARNSAGILADVNLGSIVNVAVSGGANRIAVNADVNYAGGLAGVNHGLIALSGSSAIISNIRDTTGGLVGLNETSGRIIESYAAGDISNTGTTGLTAGYVGGLAGINNGTVQRSFSTGNIRLDGGVSPSLSAGGFVGRNAGTISESWTALTNTAARNVAPRFGGFAGENTGLIENAYSTRLNPTPNYTSGAGYDDTWDAGFVYNNGGTIRNAYAISASRNMNNAERYGFARSNSGKLENVYWYAESLGAGQTMNIQPTAGATYLSGGTVNNFAAYGFDSAVWGRSQSGIPILRDTPVFISAGSAMTYGDGITSGGLTAAGLQGGDGRFDQRDSISGTCGLAAGCNPFTITNIGVYGVYGAYIDAGTWNAANILTNSPYANIRGVIRVNPKRLTISGAVENKVYDGTTSAVIRNNAANGGLVGLVGNETLDITYRSAVFQSKNAGSAVTADISYVVSDGANGGKAGNYVIANATTADIARKPVDVTITGGDRHYDGTTNATVNTVLSGAIVGDELSVKHASAVFDGENAGNRNITVDGITLSGVDAGNYALTGETTRTAAAAITPLPLTFYGMAEEGGSPVIGADKLTAANIIYGDDVTFAGSVKIASSSAGAQPITDFSGITVNNPNYTAVGSIGKVVVGDANLVLDSVAAGTAAITASGGTTTVTQTTDKAVIDWMRFSIGADEAVIFNQPSTSSIALNRVVTGQQSVIDGALRANGRVFILNAGGVLFTAGSHVNTGSLLAGAFNQTNEDFLNGVHVFTVARGGGSVVSEGDIVIADGGFVALAGSRNVSHSGTISGGNLALLASTDTLRLSENLNDAGYDVGNLTGAVDIGGSINIGSIGNIGNGGTLGAAGDAVALSNGFSLNTGSGGAFHWKQNGGIVIGDSGGFFTDAFIGGNLAARDLSLASVKGDITVNSALNWSANTNLTLSAANDININKSIAATGAESGLTLNMGGDYRLVTPATFSGAALDATGKPVASPTPSGTEFSGVSLGGTKSRLNINGNAYTLIRNMDEFAAINGKTGYFALMNDIDASEWSRANMGSASVVGGMSGTLAGMGHTVGNLKLNAPDTAYVGLIGEMPAAAGTANVLRDIGVINVDISGGSGIGALVGQAYDAVVSQVYSTGKIRTTGGYDAVTWSHNAGNIGGIAGAMIGTGIYDGDNYITGSGPRIENSFSGVDITVTDARGYRVGGLVGSAHTVDIAGSHATGNIFSPAVFYYRNNLTGEMVPAAAAYDEFRFRLQAEEGWSITRVSAANVGGLLGSAVHANIDGSWASGNITAMDGESIGGLAGSISGSWETTTFPVAVTNSFATGNVVGGFRVGGLMGDAGSTQLSTSSPITIDNVYATGTVTGTSAYNFATEQGGWIGGLIGQATTANISNAHATGNVVIVADNPASFVGGLVGGFGGNSDISVGSVSNSYATGTIAGNIGTASGGIVGNVSGGSHGSITVTDSYYSDARVEAAAENAPVRSESGGVVDDIQARYEDETRNAANGGQDTEGGGERRSLVDRYIQYGDSDGYSARVMEIIIEDDGCSEDDELCE